MDIFFLHQRGRAFMCLEISLLAAFTVSPTIGGFIVQTRPWPVTVWWTLAPIGLAMILVVAVLEETSFPRGENSGIYPSRPTSFFKNRIVTFLPGMKVVPTPSRRSVVCSPLIRKQLELIPRQLNAYVAPLKIGIAPISIFAGLYAFVAVGFTILVGIISPIPLQTPELYGGYGFSALQNALCTPPWACLFEYQSDRNISLIYRLGGHHCRSASGILARRSNTVMGVSLGRWYMASRISTLEHDDSRVIV